MISPRIYYLLQHQAGFFSFLSFFLSFFLFFSSSSFFPFFLSLSLSLSFTWSWGTEQKYHSWLNSIHSPRILFVVSLNNNCIFISLLQLTITFCYLLNQFSYLNTCVAPASDHLPLLLRKSLILGRGCKDEGWWCNGIPLPHTHTHTLPCKVHFTIKKIYHLICPIIPLIYTTLCPMLIMQQIMHSGSGTKTTHGIVWCGVLNSTFHHIHIFVTSLYVHMNTIWWMKYILQYHIFYSCSVAQYERATSGQAWQADHQHIKLLAPEKNELLC